MKTSVRPRGGALLENRPSTTARRAAWREHLLGCAAITALVFLFYPGLFVARVAALSGDHWEQHYPWMVLLARALQQGTLPFWTSFIHCGYPLAAEGQIGAFYPPNLLLCALLPIRWAYSYSSVVHFVLSGIGTYTYARRMGLSLLPAVTGAAIFLFGAACGGAYYNITSLKTIAWFPWSLAAFESFRLDGRPRWIAALAFLLALTLTAGYLQIAIFSLAIFLAACLSRIFLFPENPTSAVSRATQSIGLAVALAGAFALALPQLALTWQLALLSNRPHLSESYAYVGSLAPIAALTTLFPHWQGFLRGNCLYSGSFAIFLACCALFSRDERTQALRRTWALVGLLAFALALGAWSPLYIALVKLTRFYAFRVPAKFLVFVCFALALWAAAGLEVLLQEKAPRENIRRAARCFAGMASAAAGSFAAAWAAVTLLGPATTRAGEWFISRFIHGREGHPLTLADYSHKLTLFLDGVREIVGPAHPWTLLSLSFLAASVVLAFALARAGERRRWIAAALAFLAFDLYGYASLDFRRDLGSYSTLPAPSAVLDRLRAEREARRVVRVHGVRRIDEPLPMTPSANLLENIPDIGAYSPLVLRRYFQTFGQFGNVNDSSTAARPSPEFVTARLPLLSFVGVSHLLSTTPLQHRDLAQLTQDGPTGPFLYENRGPHAVAHVVSKLEAVDSWEMLKEKLLRPGFDPWEVALLERSEWERLAQPTSGSPSLRKAGILALEKASHEAWQVDVSGPGLFVVSETAYPGWTVTVNGEPARVISAYGMFQSVWLRSAGSWRVEFRYQPFRDGWKGLFPKGPLGESAA